MGAAEKQIERRTRPWDVQRGLTRKNRQTSALIYEIFEGIGGLPAAIEWAKENRDTFYSKIWAALARQVNVSAGFADGSNKYQFRLGLEVGGDEDAEEDLVRVAAEVNRDPDAVPVEGVVSLPLFTPDEAPVLEVEPVNRAGD